MFTSIKLINHSYVWKVNSDYLYKNFKIANVLNTENNVLICETLGKIDPDLFTSIINFTFRDDDRKIKQKSFFEISNALEWLDYSSYIDENKFLILIEILISKFIEEKHKILYINDKSELLIQNFNVMKYNVKLEISEKENNNPLYQVKKIDKGRNIEITRDCIKYLLEYSPERVQNFSWKTLKYKIYYYYESQNIDVGRISSISEIFNHYNHKHMMVEPVYNRVMKYFHQKSKDSKYYRFYERNIKLDTLLYKFSELKYKNLDENPTLNIHYMSIIAYTMSFLNQNFYTLKKEDLISLREEYNKKGYIYSSTIINEII